MKKYDKDATCVKCGCGEIKDEHKNEGSQAHADVNKKHKAYFGLGYPYQPYPEHITRTCNNCSYTWNEAPLDDDPGGIKAMPDLSPGKVETMVPRELEIRVGDTVKSKGSCGNINYPCDVVAENGPWYCLKNGDCLCCTQKTNVTLIRKGPKVHTFEGVKWTKFVDATIPYVSRMNNRPFATLKGKTGTLTFKEDNS